MNKTLLTVSAIGLLALTGCAKGKEIQNATSTSSSGTSVNSVQNSGLSNEVVPIDYQHTSIKLLSLPTKYRIGSPCTPEPDCQKNPYIDDISISPDGRLAAYAVVEPKGANPVDRIKTIIVHNAEQEIERTRYDTGRISPVHFSPNGKRYAYTVIDGEQYFVVTDHNPGKKYAVSLGDLPQMGYQLNPAAFNEQNEIYYSIPADEAFRRTKPLLVMGDKELPLPYEVQGDFHFQSGGTISYIAQETTRAKVLPVGRAQINQLIESNCPSVSDENCAKRMEQTVCASGHPFCSTPVTVRFIVTIDRQGNVLHEGTKFTVEGSTTFGLDFMKEFRGQLGTQTKAYWYDKGIQSASGSIFVQNMDDMQEYGPFMVPTNRFVYTSDGSLIFVTSTWSDMAEPLRDGLIVDGKEIDHHKIITSFIVSSDGKSIAYEGFDTEDGPKHIVSDLAGKNIQIVGRALESEVFEPSAFSSTGAMLTSVLRDREGKERVLINEKRGELYDAIVLTPVFIDHDTKVAYAARKGHELWWVVEPMNVAKDNRGE